jgi:hypothetical protein
LFSEVIETADVNVIPSEVDDSQLFDLTTVDTVLHQDGAKCAIKNE